MPSFPPFLATLHEPEQVLALTAGDDVEPGGADLTWAYAWPAGERLGGELAAVVDCTGRRVADLGCGRGNLGLRALQLGARQVGFCDGSMRPLTWIRAVVTANHYAGRADCHQHVWGTPLPDGPWDVILGGDILYRPECVPAIVASVAASLAAGGVALLSDPRTEPDDGLRQAALAHGLVLDYERRITGYTVVRLSR